ncbi:MAG: oxidoreductase [Gammaproteobacteria bacterium]|nr:oxidoreductase [Gammaproteobacteria bacterium]|tara:strand:- start:9198 stop:10529 length:1332 start_codon:yes stop_codon:yes gene_type:complete
MKRRNFLKAGTAFYALGGLAPVTKINAKNTSANETINIGVIGCNGMGNNNLRSMLLKSNVRCAALCDIDESVLARRKSEISNDFGNIPSIYTDYRRLLDNQDIDAVIIATPDHWHCLQMIDAVSAGKHVYLEKPISNSIMEAKWMLEAANYYEKVVQVGQWQRSGQHWIDAIEYVHSGILGKIRTVKAWAYMDWLKSIPIKPDTPVPTGVDYDKWLGPAPKRPFNNNRFHFTFRWFWDYAGGLMTDWGVHLLDVGLWGMKAQTPCNIVSSGGNFAYPNSAMETPDTQQAIFEFKDFTMTWEHANGIGLGPFQRSHGVAFIGNNGTLVVDREKWEVLPEIHKENDSLKSKVKAVNQQFARKGESGLNQHTSNFINAIRLNEELACDIYTGSLAAINAHMGNVALKTSANLSWDNKLWRFESNKQANKLMTPKYRTPWKYPKSNS